MEHTTHLKKLIFPVFGVLMLISCGNSVENNQESHNLTDSLPSLNENLFQTREYIGRWAATKYSVTFDVNLFKEGKPSDSYHDFTINNGGILPGFISVTTVKMDSTGQKPHEIVNNQHRNLKGEILGEPQKEVTAVKFGENEVYLFADQAMGGFGQDAIIICKGEAIHVKFQTQGQEASVIEKDKAAFKTFLASIQVKK